MNNTIQPTNFRGAFRINYKIVPEARHQLESLLNKEEANIYNYLGKKHEIIYIVKDKDDDKIADFIFDNKELSFYYYPEINKTLYSKINNLDNVLDFFKHRMTIKIRTRQEMMRYIGEKRQTNVKKTSSINCSETNINKAPKQKYDDIVMIILNNLCIDNLRGTQRVTKKGIIKIYEDYSVGQFKMSPMDENGFRCVYAKADEINAPENRCLVDKNGNIVKYYISTAERIEFTKLFNRLVKDYNLNKAK